MSPGPIRPPSLPGSLRMGTWNLEGRSGPRQRQFLTALECDVLLLTEVPEDVDMASWVVLFSESSMRDGVRYAAVAARSLVPHPSPHPASAAAERRGRRFCSSVLPWRSSGGAAPWSGDSQATRTQAACQAIADSEIDVWGGDWNHAIEGRDGAGSRAGRAAIEEALVRLGLRVATGSLPAAGESQRSIDHIAVPLAADVDSTVRVVAADARGRLSDHDAYVVTARVPDATAAETEPVCRSNGSHQWLPLVYGLPTPSTFEAAERGEVLLGGCVNWDDAPSERCATCGAERLVDP